jgi:DtxR family Mn-dependent transcriptional regulator
MMSASVPIESENSRPTPTIEDYLGIIYTLERDGQPVIASRLAEMLDVSAPTVTITLKRMQRDGWIMSGEKKEIRLSSTGQEAAKTVIRRHMLTEWMLSRVLNVPWSQIHEEAHHLEHSISRDVEQRLRDSMEDPSFCPHGNPLPGNEALAAGWFPMTECTVGQEVIVRRIHERAEDNQLLLAFLEKNRVLPGQKARILDVLPFNETVRLNIGGEIITLGFSAARQVYVETVPGLP